MSLPPEFSNDPDAIARKIVETKAELTQVGFDLEDFDDDTSLLDEEINKMQAKIRELHREKMARTSKLADLKIKGNSLKQRLKDLENGLYAAERARMRDEEYKKRSAEIDELAKAFPWFGAIKPHQFEAAKQIAVSGGRVILGDKRGLGKSLTSLAAADLLKAEKVVIISKGEILRNFENEIKKWYKDDPDKRPMVSIVSTPKHHRDYVVDNALRHANRFFLLVNFESWWRDKSLVTRIAKLQPDTIMIDEAHHAKEIEKNNFRGLATLIYSKNKCPNPACNSNDISLHEPPKGWICNTCYHVNIDDNFMSVKNVIPMTGSPIMNRPEEFFALVNMIDKVNFPDKWQFLQRYCEQVPHTNLMGREVTKWDFRYGGSKRLLESIGPQFIQRDRKSAGVEIPDQDIQIHYLEFDREKYPRQMRAYHDLINYMGALFSQDESGKETGHMVATQASSLIIRLRQVLSWPKGIKIHQTEQDGSKRLVFQCDVDESVKIDKAVEMTAEMVGEGERVVIFSKFTAVLEELKRRFDSTKNTDEEIRAAIYYGATPNHQRDRIKLDFDASTYDAENYEYDVVLCQYQSAGEGLNFNTATQMIFIEREWNPEKEGQATGRIQRMGQTQKTTVHVLQLKDSMDINIEELLAGKQDLVGDFENNAEIVQQIMKAARRDS